MATSTDTTVGDSLLLPLDEVERLLHVSRTRIYELLGSGRLPSVKLGRRRYVRRTDLEDFVAGLDEAAVA